MSSSIDDTSKEHEQADLSNVSQVITKKKVKFNRLGEAVGTHATHFKAKIGSFVQTLIPIRFKTWHNVTKNYKDDVWNEILQYFEVPSYLRNKIEKSMPSSFRKHKSTLRKDHLDIHPNLEAQKSAIPEGIKKEDWEQFCINESDDKQSEIRAKNSERRKLSLYGHTGGRKSAAMIEHEMIKKDTMSHELMFGLRTTQERIKPYCPVPCRLWKKSKKKIRNPNRVQAPTLILILYQLMTIL